MNLDYLNIGLFIRIAIPLCFMLLFLRGTAKSRMHFFLFGLIACLFSGELNGLLFKSMNLKYAAFTSIITPIVEEVSKAFPLFLSVVLLRPKRKDLLENAMTLAIGFAILENACTVFDGTDSSTMIASALTRCFYTSFLHVFFTNLVAFAMSFIDKNKKIFAICTPLALIFVICLHGLCNFIMSTKYWYLSYCLDFVMMITTFNINIAYNKKHSNKFFIKY